MKFCIRMRNDLSFFLILFNLSQKSFLKSIFLYFNYRIKLKKKTSKVNNLFRV